MKVLSSWLPEARLACGADFCDACEAECRQVDGDIAQSVFDFPTASASQHEDRVSKKPGANGKAGILVRFLNSVFIPDSGSRIPDSRFLKDRGVPAAEWEPSPDGCLTRKQFRIALFRA